MSEKRELTRRRLLTVAATATAAVPVVGWMGSAAEAQTVAAWTGETVQNETAVPAARQVWRAMW